MISVENFGNSGAVPRGTLAMFSVLGKLSWTDEICSTWNNLDPMSRGWDG
jgi:hypothetical protein